jgi:hypothetical protein
VITVNPCGESVRPPINRAPRCVQIESKGKDRYGSASLPGIYGPLPLRPVAPNPAWQAWNSTTVIRLGQSIFDGRGFDRLPILADALKKAGCTNFDMLN